jgi:tetratricopeptide (TPR) repeat protein
MEKKESSRAVLEFKNAAQATPNDPEVYYQMGLAYWDAGDPRSSYISFRRALALNPNYADAQLRIAQIQTMTNDPELIEDAEKRLKDLADGKASTTEVLRTLAFAELKLGKPEAAVGSLDQAVAQAPQELAPAVMLARAKLTLKDAKGAEAVLEKAASDNPQSAAARRILGEFFVEQNRPADAEAAFRQALALAPSNGLTMMDLGLLELRQGKKAEGEQIFKNVSALAEYESTYAIYLYQDGRREEATREFERLARENPDNRQMRTNLIIAYWATNREADAERLLANVLKKNRNDTDALLQDAEIAIGKSQYAEAENDLNRLLKLRPDAPEAHYIMARLHLARGNTLSYRQELTEVLRFNPGLLTARVELTQNLLNAGEAGAVLQLVASAPKDQLSSIVLLVQRNWALWNKGDLAEMRRGIDQGLAIQRTTDLLVQDGFWKLRSGKPAEARAALDEALKIDPNDLRALRGISQSYLAERNASMAVRKAEEFASKYPKSAPVQEFLGGLLLREGNRGAARTALEAAKAADPKSAAPELSLVQIDMVEGKLDDARRRLEAILSKDRDNQTARHWLADLDTMGGKNDAAIRLFREEVTSDSGNAEAYNNLAYLLIDKQPDEALKYAQKAVEMAPDRPAYSDTLGWAMYHEGLYAAAVPHLERAAAKGGDPVWTYHLAMAYAKSGDLARGRTTLQTALKKNPNVPEAKLAKEIVGQ